jgi:hypothetical protein
VGENIARVVRYVSVEMVRKSGAPVAARVELRRDTGERYVGTAESQESGKPPERVAAEAAMNAVCQAARLDASRMSLKEVQLTTLGARPIVVVALSGSYRDQVLSLIGACQVEGDAPRAAALAVLNATNRLLATG